MSRVRKPRSVAIELPHSGALPASGTCSLTYARTCCSASCSVTVDARTSCGEPGRRVHLLHDREHPGELLLARADDDVDAVAEDVQLAVGDERGDLDEQVGAELETGHLAVDPHEPVRTLTHARDPNGRCRVSDRATRVRRMADSLESIRTAYAFEGPALELGALVLDGQAHPDARVRIPLSMLNRHGLVAGATGTGKTKTLQLIAEQLSDAGVPVFLADIKGDVSGMAAPGAPSDRVTARAADTGTDWQAKGFPCEFLSLGGLGTGVPVRATVTSFGPVLLSKVLGLNETQESSLGLVFHFADKAGLPLLDLKDLRAVITHLVSDEGKADLEGLGGLAKATAGVILRELVGLEAPAGTCSSASPSSTPPTCCARRRTAAGVLSVMGLTAVQDKPQLFSTFLMWLLADLFHDLPEVGDVDKPGLVFFLDEAHLLFDDASEAFLDAIARTVRLIRSKGVGVFFVTQTPKDVPGEVLAQLGNRVQHALRAFTPDDAKALRATVSTFPTSTLYDLEELLPAMGIGEAVVTVLSDNGAPTPVAWTRLRPPASLMAQLDPAQQQAMVAASELLDDYGTPVDRDSAYERLLARVAPPEPPPAPQQAAPGPSPGRSASPSRGRSASRSRERRTDGGAVAAVLGSTVFRSFARSAASAAGREIARSLFGTASRSRRKAPRRRRTSGSW